MASEAPAAPPQQPVVETQPLPESTGGGKKMLLWFVIGLVAVIVLVGGVYFFLSKQNPPQPEVATQTPAPAPAENLENDLNSINVDTSTASSDFTLIDQDLQQL